MQQVNANINNNSFFIFTTVSPVIFSIFVDFVDFPLAFSAD